MRSRASFKGHPIHTAIIPFPFAFLTGALAFDVLGWLFAQPTLRATAAHLTVAGVLSALVAAVPGAIDYLYTVPPRSSGKRRATQHMLFNLSAVAVMTAAWILRRTSASELTIVGVEALGVALLCYGSLLGGVLVTRNQISIDHRYADAGKWKEVTIEAAPGASVAVASNEELKPNQMKLVRIRDRRIVVARTEDRYVAFDDRCTHRGASLADGAMICGIVQCPWHGSHFDVRSGEVKAGPAKDGIRTYVVDARDGSVFLTV